MAGYWFWRPCSDCTPFCKKLFAEGGYQGPKSRTALAKLLPELAVEIVKRSDTAQSAAPTFRSPRFLSNRWGPPHPRGVQAVGATFECAGVQFCLDRPALGGIGIHCGSAKE
jgi:hypothetical protein